MWYLCLKNFFFSSSDHFSIISSNLLVSSFTNFCFSSLGSCVLFNTFSSSFFSSFFLGGFSSIFSSFCPFSSFFGDFPFLFFLCFLKHFLTLFPLFIFFSSSLFPSPSSSSLFSSFLFLYCFLFFLSSSCQGDEFLSQ